jgi:hypothetical protein
MPNSVSRNLLLLLSALFLTTALVVAREQPSTLDELRQGFMHPPDDARIMMRWWWFGPAVTQPELARELGVMKDAGIGGVEIQPVYPLELDDSNKPFRNSAYLSDDFLEKVRFASQEAKRLGMRVDITLGSGWPFGGPHTTINHAAGRLRFEKVNVPDGATSLALPDLENGEQLISIRLAEGDLRNFTATSAKTLTVGRDGRVQLPSGLTGAHVALFFIAGRTGMQVKRPSIGAEGFVLDHYERAAIEQHLAFVGNRLMQAFGPVPPYAVFSDSLEVHASDWTPNLLDEFRRRRDYDLAPYLPALVGDMGDVTSYVRHDWGQTLTELAEENYLTPLREWAHQHHTRFRSQTYGTPPVILSSNALVDLPEGEAGPQWRTFNTARWASSASHLYGRPVTSSETWTWLHSPAFRATPLDMKAEADLHFVEGINQLIGHGWPYSPPSAPEPGPRFYAAAAFNEHNPWFPVMPDVARYLQRLSFLMRQGSAANDIAIYLPTDDAWASFTAKQDSVDRSMAGILGPALIPGILNAGYNFDFIDDRAISSKGVPYRILILPGVERMPLTTVEKLRPWVRGGGIVVATRRLPSLAPGLIASKTEGSRVADMSNALFHGANTHAVFVERDEALPDTLKKLLTPDFSAQSDAEAFGFVHRKMASADVYFVANTSNRAIETRATFRVTGLKPEWWDPFSGQMRPAAYQPEGQRTSMLLKLEPYESRVIVFSNHILSGSPTDEKVSGTESIDLSSHWSVTFSRPGESEKMPALRSWTDDEKHRYYSGVAVYEKTIKVPERFLNSHVDVMLDFGKGTPVPVVKRDAPGMRAWLESPVREAAEVYVNGQRAGYVWHPPYRVNIKTALHPGDNKLRIIVGNSAINVLAGQTPPTYKLLNAKYGVRFTPQDMDNLRPLPSGILGPVHLVAR